MYINILQHLFEDGKRIMGNIERNKLISLWMDFPSKRCGWISIVDLTVRIESKIPRHIKNTIIFAPSCTVFYRPVINFVNLLIILFSVRK